MVVGCRVVDVVVGRGVCHETNQAKEDKAGCPDQKRQKKDTVEW